VALLSLCRSEELAPGTIVCKRLPSGRQIALAHCEDQEIGIVAFEARCPHFRGPLWHGQLRGRTIICPWHFFRFDLSSGKPPNMESVMRLQLFPVTLRDGEVFVELDG
jgi:nitrite reductase/ring-hydroxylating ferredoxin subunit